MQERPSRTPESTHHRTDGRRHDLITATRHDALADQDYRQLAGHGIPAARDGVRWHLVEGGVPGRYDWSSFLPMLRAAEAAGAEVREAIRDGVPVEGFCLYPVLSHPGWDDDRYCPNGLLEFGSRDGLRMEHAPLAAELRRQQRLLTAMLGEQAGEDRAEEANGPQPGPPWQPRAFD